MSIFKKVWNSKYFPLFLFFIYLTVPFILYGYLYRQNQVFLSGDGLQYYSGRLFINNSIKSGDFPFWNPYLANGAPFAGDVESVFYPFSLMGLFLSAKNFIFLYYGFHLALGGVFTFLYLNQIQCSRIASLCTSIIYVFSIHLGGLRKSHIVILVAVVYLPVILFFAEKYLQSGNIRHLIFTAFAMALQFYTCTLQYVFYTDLVVFFYLLLMGVKRNLPAKKILKDGFTWGGIYAGLTLVQLLPIVQILQYYRTSGSGTTSFGTFQSWCMHPVKVIMMLFPRIFSNNVIQPFGNMNSSELDIEIFLGVGVFLIILYGIIYYHHEFRTKLLLFITAVTILYCVQAHIPVLSKILFQIPIVNGFRCCSRALFIFIFFAYVLFAISLTQIAQEQSLERLKKFICSAFITLLCIMVPVGIVIIFISGSDESVSKQYFHQYIQTFLSAFVVIGVMLLTLWLLHRKVNYKTASNLLPILLAILTLLETLPYSRAVEPSSVTDFGDVSSLKMPEKIVTDLQSGKVWSESSENPFSTNSNILFQIPTINAYTAFNNPRLFRLFTHDQEPTYNASGLLLGFPDAASNLKYQNDLLSMLGAKYIFDSQNLLNENINCLNNIKLMNHSVLTDRIAISNKEEITLFFRNQISVKPNTLYKIDFDLEASENGNSLSLDFNAPSYDFAQQERAFSIKKGTEELSFYINSGDISKAKSPIYLRIFGAPTVPCQISNLEISEISGTAVSKQVYKKVSDNGYRIYENTNAKDILYSPQSVQSIRDVNAIYNNVYSVHLDSVSYVENFKNMDLADADTQIRVNSFRNNFISATVSSDRDTFVNFSQNYFPGWHAYIDGKETKDYMVNGLIQGAKVSKGNHTLVFRYIPTVLYLGAVISVLSLLIGLFVIVRKRKKDKN